MASKRVARRLAAILSVDMVAYSRLMEADEVGTIRRHAIHRNELIDPKITAYNERIVKTTGDGMLVEFASAVDAVECAVDIQQAMGEREANQNDGQRIQFQIGLNVGDIVIDGDDILGDDVNVAARLEGPSGGRRGRHDGAAHSLSTNPQVAENPFGDHLPQFNDAIVFRRQ